MWRQICADIFGVPTVCLASAEGAALGAAIQAAYACHSAQGKPVTFRELCGRIVQLDARSRCVPDEKLQPVYATLLSRQGEVTRRMHAGGLL